MMTTKKQTLTLLVVRRAVEFSRLSILLEENKIINYPPNHK